MKKEDIQGMLNVLNNRFESIKFTYELEKNGILPFLDLELQRAGDKIEIGIYHKPTSTMRTITSDSYCPIQHKMAAYHSMVHRLCRLPLSVANFKKEYEHIKEVARINGFDCGIIDKLIQKHSQKVKKWSLTTLFSQTIREQKQRVSLTFAPSVTNKLKQVFNGHDLEIVYRNDRKLQSLLGSTKDKTDSLKKSGVYTIKCQVCERRYYGQTKRSLEERFKEHLQCVRLNQPQRSAVASHVLIDGHEGIDKSSLQLLKQVNDERKLDAYEAYYIQRDGNALNLDNGNIESALFRLVH